jgi:nitrogen fixation NifU-like protein
MADPKNMGELAGADAVGTAGSPGCGDALRIWLKFREGQGGEKVIDQATFQSFGCETAIAVASAATEMLAGKNLREARDLKGEEMSAPLGPLPPMKIHCAALVEEALRQALDAAEGSGVQAVQAAAGREEVVSTLREALPEQQASKKIVFLPKTGAF